MAQKTQRKHMFPENGYVFDTHTPLQNEFIQRVETDGIDSAVKWLKSVKNSELSHPQTLVFHWDGKTGDELELSKNEDFSDSLKYKCDDCECEIGNFEIGTKYFWRINGEEVGCFFTADNRFRFIKIDGVLNVRDIGGINIKQGMVYRGSDMDLCYHITDEGKRVFCHELGIKTEIELRHDVDGTRPSAAGDEVKLKHLPYKAYETVFEKEWLKPLCDIMEFLSDESNYPVYIHCLGGADRTGMIAIFLRSLCGETDEDIHLDYELTSLSTYAYGLAEGAAADGFRRRDSVYYDDEFIKVIQAYAPEKTLSVQIRAFLKEAGVTDECMNKIVSILKKGRN